MPLNQKTRCCNCDTGICNKISYSAMIKSFRPFLLRYMGLKEDDDISPYINSKSRLCGCCHAMIMRPLLHENLADQSINKAKLTRSRKRKTELEMLTEGEPKNKKEVLSNPLVEIANDPVPQQGATNNQEQTTTDVLIPHQPVPQKFKEMEDFQDRDYRIEYPYMFKHEQYPQFGPDFVPYDQNVQEDKDYRNDFPYIYQPEKYP